MAGKSSRTNGGVLARVTSRDCVDQQVFVLDTILLYDLVL